MNISILHTTGSITCRPDTTLQREDAPLYLPDGVKTVEYSPILIAKLSRSGKSIGEKFVSRYYESIGLGALLYIDGSEIFDHSSVIPEIFYSKLCLNDEDNLFEIFNDLENEDNRFEIFKNAVEIYGSQIGHRQQTELEEGICRLSTIVSQRIGDLVALELAPRSPLLLPQEEKATFRAQYCENRLFDFELYRSC